MEEPRKITRVTAVRLPSVEMPPLAAPPAFPLAVHKTTPPVVRPSGQITFGPVIQRSPIPTTPAAPRFAPQSSITSRAFPTTSELLGQIGTFMPDCLAADEVVDNENIDGLVVMENVEEPYDDDDDLDDGDGGGGDFDGFEDDGWGGGGGNSRPLLEGKPQRLLKEDGSASSLRGHLLEGPKGGSLKLPGRAMKPKALPWMSAESEG